MRSHLIAMGSAALLLSFALIFTATARDQSDRVELTANQMVDQASAQTARMKAALRLTSDQEKNWSGFQTAMQDMSKKRADRDVAMRDELSKATGTEDVLEQISKDADAQIVRANELKKLADASKPLYASLDEQQKHRFAESLFGGERGRDAN